MSAMLLPAAAKSQVTISMLALAYIYSNVQIIWTPLNLMKKVILLSQKSLYY